MKKTIFIANWKMQKRYKEECIFFNKYATDLCNLTKESHAQLILCPSFVGLPTAQEYLSKTPVNYGAQDCSAYKHGAYTGEISAQSLSELECTHCLIGHSERRKYYHEDEHITAQKAKRLLENNIIPIICIGESFKEYQQEKKLDVLKRQLQPILSLLVQDTNKPTELYIAYEPVWAIGSGIIPKKDKLQDIFTYLNNHYAHALPGISLRLLYGGSVNATNCVELASIAHVDGFLIGGASLDFQTLKNIVSLVTSEKK